MNEEESNDMPSWDPYTAVPSEGPTEDVRSLAAILFTDVVGFSKMTSQNEARVYVAVQRDMGIIQKLCRAHNGEVLNTMGDGMLMSFGSAVAAMTCALEIQRTLYVQAKSLPPQEVLHHRMGVHLGDIIRRGTNVFGEGVNIAARLQAKSKPDGICYSQNVHDVIKSKMKVEAKYTGPLMLKNIPDPVKIWEVPPIREGGTVDIAMPERRHSDIPGGAVGIRAISLFFTASIILVIGGWGVVAMINKTKIPPTSGTGRPVTGFTAPDRTRRDTKTVDSKDPVQERGQLNPGGSTPLPGQGTTPPALDATATVKPFLAKYDFDGAVTALGQQGLDKTPEGLALTQKIGSVKALWAWITDELSAASLERPLETHLQSPNGQMIPAKVYSAKEGIMVDAGSGPTANALTDFRPNSILIVASDLAVKPLKAANPNAAGMISAFVELYGLRA